MIIDKIFYITNKIKVALSKQKNKIYNTQTTDKFS